MVSGPQSPIWASTVHVRQSLAHVVTRNHGHVLDPKGQEDMLLEVVIERQAGCALQCNSRPVDANLFSSAMRFPVLSK